MMKCIRCGREFHGSPEFCPFCGIKINKPAGDIRHREPAPARAANDRKSGGMPGGYADGRPERPEVPEVKKNKTVPIMIGLVGVLSVIVCILAIILLLRQGSGSESGRASNAPSEQTSYEVNDNKRDESQVEGEETKAVKEEEKNEEAEDQKLAEEVQDKDSKKAKKVSYKSTKATTIGGDVKVSAVDFDPAGSTITLRIENNTGEEVQLFSNPVQVIDGESIALDPYSNMGISANKAAPGSVVNIPLVVDSGMFEKGGIISGELFCMGYFGDKSFEIEISRK